MKEFQNEHYRVEVDDEGMLRVWSRENRVLQKTVVTPDGVVKSSQTTVESADNVGDRLLLAALNRTPMFAVCYGGGAKWHCDIDCGAQRFLGTKKKSELITALKNCGFDPDDEIANMLALCKKHIWDHCPRQVW